MRVLVLLLWLVACLGWVLTPPKFRHIDVAIDECSYTELYDHRQQLLAATVGMLEAQSIRYVLAAGNLIEHVRGAPILQDDDLDIRIHRSDVDKLASSPVAPGLDFSDARARNATAMRINGVQYGLLRPFRGLPPLAVHIDVVPSNVALGPWISYDYAFTQPLRTIRYMGVSMSAPSQEATHALLSLAYGPRYMTPNLASAIATWKVRLDPNVGRRTTRCHLSDGQTGPLVSIAPL